MHVKWSVFEKNSSKKWLKTLVNTATFQFLSEAKFKNVFNTYYDSEKRDIFERNSLKVQITELMSEVVVLLSLIT